jgi:methyl-accepting chemotaxis protein
MAFGRMPRAMILEEINTATSDYRLFESVHILALDDAAIARAEDQINRHKSELDSLYSKYASYPMPDTAKANLAAVKQAWASYLTIHNKLLDLSRKQENDKATALFLGEHKVAFELVSDLLDKESKRLGELVVSDAKAADTAASLSLTISIALGAIFTLIVASAIIFVIRGVIRPLNAVTGVMAELTGRNYGVAIPGAQRQDEIGTMARSLGIFRDSLIEAENLAAAQRSEQQAKEERQRRVEDFIANFDTATARSLSTMAGAATQLESTAHLMSDSAALTNTKSSEVASASAQASANVQTVATASEELSSTILEISRQVQESSTIARKAKEDTQHSANLVRSLDLAAQRIDAVVTLISGVAAQTNLLALNATIEAARAGAAGKGFAVVASEVKNLAMQTAKATDEIASQVKAVQAETGAVVAAIENVGGTIDRLSEISAAVASAVEQQNAATQEIASNVQQAASGTQLVSDSIVDVATAANHTGAAATQVQSAADELSRQGAYLQKEVESFLDNIRAA